ncbi:P2X purinoceptor 7-like isoform X2 [Melanotaenia boesemani]|uniref:P2X purinoceptor 7-like isoform X2 n=1 Tax=Melanotaenia boesemani TaxID=1250792 RepID=UPI001C04A208|nr:P2X purinoceptor 7-like isoform X2 [Melanotaenia boesemani]XP_041854759.1 P2X purinoceptor 7-like isoform X2 [Melanotaenia boesemani]
MMPVHAALVNSSVMATGRDAVVLPYQFEPESDPEGEISEEGQTLRLQQGVSAWCTCGNCETMPTEAECVCCLEIPQVTRRLQEVDEDLTCMVDHPGFEPVCLNIYSLQNASQIYRADYGRLQLRGIHRRFRYLAYRSFVSWCWGFLGQRIRVVIPACVVLRIHREFPDAEGHYVGFKLALD